MNHTYRVIRLPRVQEITGLSRSAIYRLEKAGSFPLHFLPTPRVAVWDEAEITAWVERQKAAARSNRDKEVE